MDENTQTKRKSLKLNKKGFTLLEMVLTVAIIAVLLAIAMPSYTGVLSNVKETVCHANLATIERFYKYVQVLEYYDSANVTIKDVYEGKYDDYGLDVGSVRCPSGEAYLYDEADNVIYCPIHGDVNGVMHNGGTHGSGSSNTNNSDTTGTGETTTSNTDTTSTGETTTSHTDTTSTGETTTSNTETSNENTGEETSSQGENDPKNYMPVTDDNVTYKVTVTGEINSLDAKNPGGGTIYYDDENGNYDYYYIIYGEYVAKDANQDSEYYKVVENGYYYGGNTIISSHDTKKIEGTTINIKKSEGSYKLFGIKLNYKNVFIYDDDGDNIYNSYNELPKLGDIKVKNGIPYAYIHESADYYINGNGKYVLTTPYWKQLSVIQ